MRQGDLPRIENEDAYRAWASGEMFEAALCLIAALVIFALFLWAVSSGRVP